MLRPPLLRAGIGLALGLALLMRAEVALATVPVSLPPGEPLSEWTTAFAAGGFVSGPIGEGEWVQLTDSGDYWLLRVRDAKGQLHDANVLPPQSEQDRADTIWLAMSLLKVEGSEVTRIDTPPPVPPATLTTPPADPAATVTLTRPDKPAKPAKPARPEKPAQPIAAAQPTSTATATASVTKPPPEPGATRVWAQVGGGIGWRAASSVGADLHLGAGVRVADHLRIGLGLDLLPGAALSDLGEERNIGAFDVTGGVAYAIGTGVTPVVGLVGGVSMRSFTQAGEPVQSMPVPIGGVDLAVIIPVAGPLHLVPFADLRYDLRQITLKVGDTQSELSPISIQAGLALELSPGGKP